MNQFNRTLVCLEGFALVVAGVIVLAAASGGLNTSELQGIPWSQSAIVWIQGQMTAQSAVVIGSSIGMALLGLGLLYVQFSRPDVEDSLLLDRGPKGQTSVSVEGLRRLAEQVIGPIPGVHRVLARAINRRGSVQFRCRIEVLPESSVPELQDEVRGRLAAAIQNHIGQAEAETRIDIHCRVRTHELSRRRVQ